MADSVEDLQRLVTNGHIINRTFSLTLNKAKTEFQIIFKGRTPMFLFDDEKLKQVCRRYKLGKTSIRETSKCQIQ